MRNLGLFFVLTLMPVFLEAAPGALRDVHFSVMGEQNGVGAESLALPQAREFAERSLATPPEFAPASELQMTSETFRRIERAVIHTVDQTADLIVLVNSDAEGARLINEFRGLGGNVDRLKPVNISHNSIWYQDYGPIYAIDADGSLVSNDFTYARYNRHADDASPGTLARLQSVRNRPVTMNYEGGNFISDGHGACFASHRIYDQNPQLREDQVNDLMRANLGCQKMVILTPLVDDITYHIDLFAKLVAENTFMVGDFPEGTENKTIMDENARVLESMGYQVRRIPVQNPNSENYLTHINTFLINGYALMPIYGIPEDRVAKEAYEQAGFKVLEINARDLQNTGGAIHCILRSKPAL